MKKLVTISIIFLLAVSFLVAGSKRAEAAHNDSVTVRAAATIIFGQPFVNAVAREVVYAGPGYVRANPVHYRHGYPSTRYIERTKMIHGKRRHFIFRHRGWDHGKGFHDRWCRHEYRHDRDDARRGRRRSAH